MRLWIRGGGAIGYYSESQKINFSAEDIVDYVDKNYVIEESERGTKQKIRETQAVIDAWKETIEKHMEKEDNVDYYSTESYVYRAIMFNTEVVGDNSSSGSGGTNGSGSSSDSNGGGTNGNDSSSDSDDSSTDGSTDSSHPIYHLPQREDNPNTSSASLDDMMNDADDFVNSGGNIQYDQSALQDFSANFYNIMLTVGVAIAVIVGGVLGIKFMLASVEERADIKKMLIGYVAGCVIVFGGFGIWKLVVTILEGI